MQPSPILEEVNQLIAAGRSAEAVTLLERNSADRACALRLRELCLGEKWRDKAMAVSRELAVGHDAEAHVSRSVIALLQGDPERALREITLALENDPGLATVHNHLGRALHNTGQSLGAVSALRKAVELRDDYPEAWSNLGLVLRAGGSMDEAIKAYRRAVELAPGFVAAELNLGISLLLAEQVDQALFCLEAVLQRDPNHLEALLNAGLALHLRGRLGQARRYFEQAIHVDEHNALAWFYLGALLHELDEAEPALDALHKALAFNPGEIEAWVEVASIHEQAGRLDEADTALERAAQIDPRHPAMQLELARLRRRQGKLEEALEWLRKLASRQLPPRLAQQYCFESGIALDRAGHYDQAFEAYATGNQLLAGNVRRQDVDPRGFERECETLSRWLQRGAPGGRPRDDDPVEDRGADLCFLVGFQRSGTTLLETMLDAHPDIASIEERPTLERVIDELHAGKPAYPDAMETLDAAAVTRLRGLYRAEVERHLGGRKAALVVDKLPLRFMHAGLIHRLFPEARILFALRHPCDVVLSNFMQVYAVSEASIHFDTLQSSAAIYARAMGLWRQIEERLPLRLQYTRYEALVADPEAEISSVCSYLGVEPVAAMFDHSARMAGRAPVRTASYQQVAEPLHQRSAGRWLNYRTQLAPHLPVLRPFAEHYGYSVQT